MYAKSVIYLYGRSDFYGKRRKNYIRKESGILLVTI